MNIFLVDTSVVAHLINSRLQQYGLSAEDQQLYIAASFLWINSLGMMPYFADADRCHCIWLMDSKPYWRSQYCPEYKAKRPPTSAEIGMILDVFHALALPSLTIEGYEADDLAALFCVLYRKRPLRSPWQRTYLLTIDSDWQGLIGDGITWVDVNGHEPRVRDAEQLYGWLESRHQKQAKKWQRAWPMPCWQEFSPRDIWRWKSVVGDRADNLAPYSPIGLIDLYQPCAGHELWKDETTISMAQQIIANLTKSEHTASEMVKVITGLGVPMPLGYIVM